MSAERKGSVLEDRLVAYAATLPEGHILAAKALPQFGARAVVTRSLSQLVRHGRLLRVGRGLYVLSAQGRFGERPPTVESVIRCFSAHSRATVVRSGAAAANVLGLTTQTPVRHVYLTSGRSRQLQIGRQCVELQHAPSWRLAFSDSTAGDAIRALAWLGPEHARSALEVLRHRLPDSAFEEMAAVKRLPTWLRRLLEGRGLGALSGGRTP
ncbi:MAG: DUF6088 family protein [Candidatus Brevundimonas colombiensis]|uniref:DUF6088 family protein n=1 Tax=Candidatus Brevundimonas colombiensis TaxID=3121376 RepID=A0AAJ5X0R1_9CAUL|nr:DUF6088 family protein [Brevundimonas sp.]WEK39839.1 MAG: DUF6088 family protein [Brevundimonas sp.]